LRAALTAAAKAHREAQDEVTDALDRLEETNKRLMAAARAVRNYTTEERAE
jgi:pilus assembly protein TadC